MRPATPLKMEAGARWGVDDVQPWSRAYSAIQGLHQDDGTPALWPPVMVDVATAAEKLIGAYNAKDFTALEQLIAADLDFAHYNRNFVMKSRDELLGILRAFAADYIPDRHFEPVERVTVAGDIVVREAWYAGTPIVDLPGFGAAGEAFRLKFCSVMRFDDAGLLVEWKDHG